MVLAGFLVSLGMEGYAKVQRVCFYIGLAALALVMVIMLFGSRAGFAPHVQHGVDEPVRHPGDTYTQVLKDTGA